MVLGELIPGQTYYYRVGSSVDGWSEEFKFVSAPNAIKNFTFSMFGDLGALVYCESVLLKFAQASIMENPQWHSWKVLKMKYL